MRVVVTAGFGRALNVLAAAELLTREGHEVAGIIVVTPFNPRRLRRLMLQRGRSFPAQAARKLLGRSPVPAGRDEMASLLSDEGIEKESLRSWAGKHGARYVTVSSLDADRAAAALRELAPDGVVYGGGGIVHDSFLEAAEGRIINSHHGRMPEIRGMNASEWSLLLGVPPEVTVHVIDRGIDTGAVLERIPVPIEPGDTVAAIRSRSAAIGVRGLVRNTPRLRDLPPPQAGAESHLQCFTLAPALLELLEERLAGGPGE